MSSHSLAGIKFHPKLHTPRLRWSPVMQEANRLALDASAEKGVNKIICWSTRIHLLPLNLVLHFSNLQDFTSKVGHFFCRLDPSLWEPHGGASSPHLAACSHMPKWSGILGMFHTTGITWFQHDFIFFHLVGVFHFITIPHVLTRKIINQTKMKQKMWSPPKVAFQQKLNYLNSPENWAKEVAPHLVDHFEAWTCSSTWVEDQQLWHQIHLYSFGPHPSWMPY